MQISTSVDIREVGSASFMSTSYLEFHTQYGVEAPWVDESV